MKNIITATDETFDEVVLKSANPVIVDFWAVWCVPCRAMSAVLDKIAIEYADKAIVVKVNSDENHALIQKYDVQGIPTLLFVSGGKVISRTTGRTRYSVIKEQLDALCQSPSPE